MKYALSFGYEGRRSALLRRLVDSFNRLQLVEIKY